MIILLVSFVTSSLKTGGRIEVKNPLIHGCKYRGLFWNWEVGFGFFAHFSKVSGRAMSFDFVWTMIRLKDYIKSGKS
jgi:hypothetical protein